MLIYLGQKSQYTNIEINQNGRFSGQVKIETLTSFMTHSKRITIFTISVYNLILINTPHMVRIWREMAHGLHKDIRRKIIQIKNE